MTKTETLKMQSKMRRLCRAAIRKFAADHGFKVERGRTDLVIFSLDRKFYVSARPHGEALHRLFEPGRGCVPDWEWFFNKGVCLSETTIFEDGFRLGDNFNLDDQKSVRWVVKRLRTDKRQAEQARA
jgi:hypothetical protein